MTLFTGITPLYGSSLLYAGPASLVWGWVVVSFFTWFVGVAMSEICSSFPVRAILPWCLFLDFVTWVFLINLLRGRTLKFLLSCCCLWDKLTQFKIIRDSVPYCIYTFPLCSIIHILKLYFRNESSFVLHFVRIHTFTITWIDQGAVWTSQVFKIIIPVPTWGCYDALVQCQKFCKLWFVFHTLLLNFMLLMPIWLFKFLWSDITFLVSFSSHETNLKPNQRLVSPDSCFFCFCIC